MDRKRTLNSMCGNRTVTGADHGGQDKSADRGRAHVVGWIDVFDRFPISVAVTRRQFANEFNIRSACLAKT
jgi:hypothetical protein